MKDRKDNTPRSLVPYGLLATRKWLKKQGLQRHTLDNWLKSEQLESIAQGVYTQPDTKLTWEGIVCSLQRMGISLTPGGLTALQFNGHSHYLELTSKNTIHLYGTDKMPAWVNQINANIHFIHHNDRQLSPGGYLVGHPYNAKLEKLYSNDPLENGLKTNYPWWGENDWPLTMSTTELAWFEVLLDVPEKISFDHADQIMQSLANLSPRRLNKLMDRCKNFKVLRLFLWFAERHKHAWFKKIDTEKFTIESGKLGSGKRMLAKNGKLDTKYLITVPKEMYE